MLISVLESFYFTTPLGVEYTTVGLLPPGQLLLSLGKMQGYLYLLLSLWQIPGCKASLLTPTEQNLPLELYGFHRGLNHQQF